MQKDFSHINTTIKNEALRLGFDACGFAKADHLSEDADRLKTWLGNGKHADMAYMANNFDKRTDPRELVEGAKTVISLLLNYYSDRTPTDPEAPIISKYAYGIDYHFVIKDKMKSLYNFIDQNFGPVSGRVFTDSAPVLEHAWARAAGLGWIGKNSNLINRNMGSFFFIGELIIDLELDYNKVPESDYCGECNKCIEACPTSAIQENRTIDAERCISYLTIENKGPIPEGLSKLLSNRMYGCDICQDVCPWNRKATLHTVKEFEPHPELLELTKDDWRTLDRDRFNRIFKNSAVKRAGYEGLRRNIQEIIK